MLIGFLQISCKLPASSIVSCKAVHVSCKLLWVGILWDAAAAALVGVKPD
jgi:hypothetical protein